MNLEETSGLLALAALTDRQPEATEEEIGMWQVILAPLDVADATEALVQHYRVEKWRPKPGELFEGVRLLRNRRERAQRVQAQRVRLALNPLARAPRVPKPANFDELVAEAAEWHRREREARS